MTRGESVVYFVRIDRHIKIGVTTNLAARLKTFETSSHNVGLLLSIPGDRAVEQRLHNLLAEARIAREIFHHEYRIQNFIEIAGHYGVERAMQFLEETTPGARSKKKAEDRQQRTLEARKTKQQKDEYFASLVAERKQRLGW